MPHPPECQDPLATSRLAEGSPQQAGLKLGHRELPLLANEHTPLLMLLPSQAVCSLTELVTRLNIVLRTLQNTTVSVNVTTKSLCTFQKLDLYKMRTNPVTPAISDACTDTGCHYEEQTKLTAKATQQPHVQGLPFTRFSHQ